MRAWAGDRCTDPEWARRHHAHAPVPRLAAGVSRRHARQYCRVTMKGGVMWQISARARIGRAILSLLVGGTVAGLWPATSQAATGDQVATVHFSQDCASGLGVGVAY